MNGKRISYIMVVALILVVFSCPSIMAAGPIKIGIIQGLSGPYEIYGKAEKNSD